jgi:hypothetical protein
MTASGSTATTANPERLSPETTAGLTTTAARNSEANRTSEGDCEWVNSFTREDGTYVRGHWTGKPGYGGRARRRTQTHCPHLTKKR